MKFYDLLAKNHLSNNEKEEYNYLNKLDSQEFFNEIRKVKGKKVLEIGSGTGRITEKIINEHPSALVSVEFSSKTAKILSNKFPKLILLKSLSQVKDKFDFIIFAHTLIHVKEKSKVFEKLASLLCPGGKIVLSELFQEKPLYVLDKSGNKVFQEIYPINVNEIKLLVKDKGFLITKEEIVKVDSNKIPPFEKSEIGKNLTWFLILERNNKSMK